MNWILILVCTEITILATKVEKSGQILRNRVLLKSGVGVDTVNQET